MASPTTSLHGRPLMDGTHPDRFTAAHDMDVHPYYRGGLSRWVWRFAMCRMTQAARWSFLPVLAMMFIAGTTLAQPFYVLLLFIAALWLIALLIALVLPIRVQVQAAHAERICAGETLPVAVTVRQVGRLGAVDLRVAPYGLPPGLAVIPQEGTPVPPLAQGESAQVTVGLCGTRRGVYALPGYRVECDFPLGLFNAYRHIPHSRALVVYPRFTRLSQLHLAQGYSPHPGGVALKARMGDSFELFGNREYQDGDDIRQIDWNATARLQAPILREYTQEYYYRVGVVLDTHVRRGARPGEVENFERAVSVCAAVSEYIARQEYLVDLFAAGPQLYHLTVGQSLVSLDEILDILACVESTPQEPFATLTPEIGALLGHITLVVCIFLEWDEARRQFVEYLEQHGVAVKVVIVRETATALPSSGMARVTKAAFHAGVEEL